jgi:hypothetical protein
VKEKGMDKSWQNWVNENLQRQCDPEEVGNILLKNKFTPAQIRKMMGDKCPQHLGQPAAGNDAAKPDSAHANSADGMSLMRKSLSMFEIQRDLARLSPKATTIERRQGVSGEEFLEKYYAANRPVILCDLMSLWEAPQKWTPEYLKRICGDEIVEITAARETNPEYEMDDAPHRKKIKFSAYIDMVMSGKETNDYYMTARNDFFARKGTRLLLEDIDFFSEYLSESDGKGAYLWFGPKGTITPLHHDLMNIFMAQVQGRKRIKLVPASEIELVYNHFAVYSQVDAAHPDYQKFPKFQFANVIDLELAPGEVLFLPVGWWHWVKALDTSITVAFNNFLFPNEFKWEHQPRGAGNKAASGY